MSMPPGTLAAPYVLMLQVILRNFKPFRYPNQAAGGNLDIAKPFPRLRKKS